MKGLFLNMKDEYKEIAGYKCQKAIGTHEGRNNDQCVFYKRPGC